MTEIKSFRARSFRGCEEDLTDRVPVTGPEECGPMLNSLIENLTTIWPPDFNLHSPDLHSLCYYPLKIAAAEWMNFVSAMEYAVEGYEYLFEDQQLTSSALE